MKSNFAARAMADIDKVFMSGKYDNRGVLDDPQLLMLRANAYASLAVAAALEGDVSLDWKERAVRKIWKAHGLT